MTFIDNRRWLGQCFRDVAQLVKEWDEKEPTGDVLVELAKSGEPTLQIKVEEKMKYVHSKYDPVKEVDRLLKTYTAAKKMPVLFFGVGLGYHIEAFIKRFPNVRFAIYEPNEEVLYHFFKRINCSKWESENVLAIITTDDWEIAEAQLQQVIQRANYQLSIISLPLYESVYTSLFKNINQKIVEQLKVEKSNLAVNVSFQKRWTTNAIKNVPYVLKTPNMLVDIDKTHFKDKPAIIVAAGPSLNREFETLRQIKEEGRAYLFSVGSAVNALVAHDIIPDAVCTYDPQGHNENVIKVIREQHIPNVPLIFGSSVGFETLINYPNQMYHMLTSQDTVMPAILDRQYPFVYDAPSIAVVTYQLLSELGCSPIILVGQNLAYHQDHHYADGIDYGKGTKATEQALKDALYTEDVFGKRVATNEGFIRMRQQLEVYIEQIQRPTINTTVGGAKIKGTTFAYLEQLLEHDLAKKHVTSEWQVTDNSYKLEQVQKQFKKLDHAISEHKKNFKNAFEILQRLYDQSQYRRFQVIEKTYGQFDQQISKLQDNLFYNAFVEPMIRVQFKLLRQVIENVRYENDATKKAGTIIPAFNDYLNIMREYSTYAESLYQEMKIEIEK